MASHTTASRRPSAPLWLPALFLLAFSIGTDDLVIAGILPAISRDLDVPVAASGQLVTAFALTYALGAPFAALLTSRLPRRAVLTAAAAAFAAANLAAAAAPTYETLMAARIVSGLAAATASPAAFALAATAAPEGRQGRFLAVVGAGLTTALVAGVPLGTWIGGALGWRSTMLFVAALAAAAGLALLPTVPRVPRAAPGRLRDRLAVLRRPGTLPALAAMIPSGAGGMMSYVYVTEIADRLGGVRGAAVAPLITAVGAAGILGALAGGRAVDALGALRALRLMLIGVLAAPALMTLLGLAGGPYPVPVVALALTLYGLATWGIAPATQAWLLERGGGPEAANELIALNNSAMFLGFALAGGIGGLALETGGPVAVTGTAAGCVLASLALFAMAFRNRPREGTGA
ncbi:MFS transporter [Spirillospora sp. CA-255316]